MIEELTVLRQGRPHPTLFEAHCPECPAFSLCGGSPSAPCGCVRLEKEKRYQCGDCHLICRDRKQRDDLEDRFETHLADGLPLDKLYIDQEPIAGLPLLIPARTHELPMDNILPVCWAAVDAKSLLSDRPGKAAAARSYLANPAKTRDHLRVSSQTRLIAVMNADDALLEGFWGMAAKRRDFYEQLVTCGFDLVTGPTFSVYTADNALASHNVAMQLRHNRVLQELRQTSLLSVPNIYWRDVRDRVKWADWLRDNEIKMITRDFSRTKHKLSFMEHLAGLVDVIKRSGRRYHVFLVGVGLGHAPEALTHLAKVGCTASIITGYPVLEASIKGCELSISGSGVISAQNKAYSNQELMAPNIEIAERELIRIASGLSIYANLGIQRNLLPPPGGYETGRSVSETSARA